MSEAKLSFTIGDLQQLPTGASFSDKSGQAGVKAELQGDVIIITATCDSLQQEIYRLETLLKQSEARHTEETKQTGYTFLAVLKWLLIGIVTGLILYPLGKKLINFLLKLKPF